MLLEFEHQQYYRCTSKLVDNFYVFLFKNILNNKTINSKNLNTSN